MLDQLNLERGKKTKFLYSHHAINYNEIFNKKQTISDVKEKKNKLWKTFKK